MTHHQTILHFSAGCLCVNDQSLTRRPTFQARIYIKITALALSIFILSGCERRQVYDPEHTSAANMINVVLGAWANRNFDLARQFIDPAALKKYGDDKLRDYFVGASNPHHAAFEIIGSAADNRKNFVFTMLLFENYTGDTKIGKKQESMTAIKNDDKYLVVEIKSLDLSSRLSEGGFGPAR